MSSTPVTEMLKLILVWFVVLAVAFVIQQSQPTPANGCVAAPQSTCVPG